MSRWLYILLFRPTYVNTISTIISIAITLIVLVTISITITSQSWY